MMGIQDKWEQKKFCFVLRSPDQSVVLSPCDVTVVLVAEQIMLKFLHVSVMGVRGCVY